MVYRILPQRHSRLRFFLHAFLRLFLISVLVAMAFVWLIDHEMDFAFRVVAPLAALYAALLAWLGMRQWTRIGWFENSRRESFLTIVEEGLVIESLHKGFAVYMPWKGLTYRCQGVLLQIFYHGVPRSIISLKGCSSELRARILADLRRYTGGRQAVHGLFTPEKAAAPFAPAAASPAAAAAAAAAGLPPVPAATLPPPVPVVATTRMVFSNTLEQWRGLVRYSQRPGKLVAGILLAAVFCCASLSACQVVDDGRLGSGAFFFFLSLYLVFRLALPGRMRGKRLHGAVEYAASQTEFFEYSTQGAWGRWRLPSVDEGAKLVRLPHGWCLIKENDLVALEVDAEGEAPPPALAHYPVEPAPRNRLRTVAALLLMGLGLVAGYTYASWPTEAELAFRALPEEPDAATLRAYAARYYAHGQVLDTPTLHRASYEGEEHCLLFFTDSAPDPEEDDGRFHLAWTTFITLSPTGKLQDADSWPVSWCPCDDWLPGPPDWLEEEDEAPES